MEIGLQFWGGGVVMLVFEIVVGLRHMHCKVLGYMQLGYSIGVGVLSCW